MTADSLAAERRAMLRFFLPLACTSALMMTSHSLIAGGIARTTLPVASLAAYSVGSNIAFMAEAPLVRVRQMTMALSQAAGYAAEMAVLYLACRRLGLTAPPRPADLSL